MNSGLTPRRAMLIAAAILIQFWLAAAGFAAPRELVFLTWSEYMDPELVERFEREHDARVRFVYFETDELRNDMLLSTDGRGYDVVCVNGVQVPSYASRGWLEPLTPEDVPNLRHIDERWATAYEGAKPYGVPFFWGTLGIAYRTDLVTQPMISWLDIFRPAQELKGKIVMIRYNRDLLGMALKALGHSVNSSSPDEIRAATDLLQEQRPFVSDYSYVSLSKESKLVTGAAYAAMMYSGDALMLNEIDPRIAYVVPAEGSNLWVDYLTVLRSSANKDLAKAFINFLNEPANAAQLAQFVYYATPNKAAEQLLPEDFLADQTIYPPADVLNRSEVYRDLPPRAQRLYNSAFADVTH